MELPHPTAIVSSSSNLAINRAKYVDARQSTFVQVGRDHTTIHHHHHHHILYISPQNSRLRPHLISIDATDNLSPTISSSEALPRGSLVTYSSSDAIAIVGATVDLIIQISEVLLGCKQYLSGHLDLALELESLQKTLALARLVIHQYDNKPLGQSLANTITPEVLACFSALRELLDSIDSGWLDFNITSVRGLWHRIQWVIFGDADFVSVRKKLCHSRQLLQGLLVSLRSVAWMELGNEISAGFVSLLRFHDAYSPRLSSLYHIKLNAVDVVSHLGEIIPVPTMFCYTWEDFNYVVKAYCGDCAGIEFIQRGDYEVIRAQDNQIIRPSELGDLVDSGMRLEMSIVMRQGMVDRKKCPRCNYINMQIAAHGGWIECRYCRGQFLVAEADPTNAPELNNARNDKGPYREVNHNKHTSSGKGSASGDEEIVSPAAQTAIETSSTEREQSFWDDDIHQGGGTWDSDDTRYFRRIHVICTTSGISNTSINLGQSSTPWSQDGLGNVDDTTMSGADMERKITEDMKEFFSVRSLEEAEIYFIALPDEHHFRLVDKLVTIAIESKEQDAQLVGDFFRHAASKGLCTPASFEKGFSNTAMILNELVIDAPKAYDLMATMVKGANLGKKRRRRLGATCMDNGRLVGRLRKVF